MSQSTTRHNLRLIQGLKITKRTTCRKSKTLYNIFFCFFNKSNDGVYIFPYLAHFLSYFCLLYRYHDLATYANVLNEIIKKINIILSFFVHFCTHKTTIKSKGATRSNEHENCYLSSINCSFFLPFYNSYYNTFY